MSGLLVKSTVIMRENLDQPLPPVQAEAGPAADQAATETEREKVEAGV